MINQLIFKVKGKEYPIKVPTAGQYYDVEATKQICGKGFYNSIIASPLQSAANAQLMIDIESFLTILCPDLIKDLKSGSFKELGIEDYMELKNAYEEQFTPWWEAVLKLFTPPKKEKVD